jgi:autophagy-related protein 13
MVGDTKSYNLGGVDCPVGFISVDVTHRDNCEFRVDSQESLLSSDFMNQDEYFFQPSLETRNSHRTGQLPYTTGREPSSAPTSGLSRPGPSVQQPINGLPVTNLATGERRIQHARNAPSISSGSPLDPTSSSYRSARESNLSLRSIENAARRSSVSFSPFKTGSVASSPGAGVVGSRVSSGTSIPMRSRPSAGAGGPLPQRMSMPTPIDSSQSGHPSSGSPRPSSMRFSSSFTNRPPRFSGASINKADEDGASSGKGSVSSSSNAWTANFPDDSGHSITEDGKKISDFMKLLELTEKKGLKSFEQKATVDPLSRFKKLRDTHAALSDSIIEPLNQSQTQQQQRSQPQQRPLSYPSASGLNSSLSSSTSPQLFQISPHTPHAPVIRSRLSEGLSAADAGLSEGRGSFHHRPRTESTSEPVSSSAIPLDIPSSPRHRTISSFRRPNSLVQNKAVTDALEDLDDPATAFANAGRQSASLGTVDTAPVSLARMREDATNAPIDRPRDGAGINTTSNLGATTTSGSSPSSSLRGRLSARGRGGWSGQNSGSASGGSGMRPGGFDDDDLLFTMSEDVMERRRISEEAGGKATGPASTGLPKESTGLPNWTTNRRI